MDSYKSLKRVALAVSAAERALVVYHGDTIVKQLPLCGLRGEILLFDRYVDEGITNRGRYPDGSTAPGDHRRLSVRPGRSFGTSGSAWPLSNEQAPPVCYALLRGLVFAKAEYLLACLAHNLGKLLRVCALPASQSATA